MTAAVSLVAAAGLVIAVSGLLRGGRDRLSARVIPYVEGIRPASPVARLGSLLNLRRDRAALIERLEAAGLDGDAGRFRVEQLAWAAGGSVATALVAATSVSLGARPSPGGVLLGSVLGSVTGWLARDRLLTRAIEFRRRAIAADLPTALDLIALAVMAGESLPAAFARVGAAMGGELGAEFGRAVGDVRSGRSVFEALTALGSRLPIHPVRRLVDALVVALENGSPLAEVLRTQAEDLRREARFELVASAGKREVAMLIPVVFLIMPVVVVFALFPGLAALELLAP